MDKKEALTYELPRVVDYGDSAGVDRIVYWWYWWRLKSSWWGGGRIHRRYERYVTALHGSLIAPLRSRDSLETDLAISRHLRRVNL